MFRNLYLLLLVAMLAHFGVGSACAQDEPDAVEADPLQYAGPPRKQDEVYRLSTRHLAEPEGGKPFEFELHRYSESDTWEPLAYDTFCRDENADRLTLIYVHGYSFDEDKANQVGWAVYHALCEEQPPRRPIRFVIWSWPTTQKRFRPTRDLADKALRADADAFYLASTLTRLKTDEPVCLIGSSLGCRVVQGALHLVGGGHIDQWKLVNFPDEKTVANLRAAFITPCVHNDWLEDGGYHDHAMAGANRLLLINNSVDSMLLRYSKVWPSHPVALGLDGIEHLAKLGDFASRVEQFDAHEDIGDNHGVEHYLRNSTVVDRLRAFAHGE